jgi:ABC-type polysaccharide/polyol phosphate export permease
MRANPSSSTTGLLLRDSEWTVMRRVIGALLLRELLTRYGRNNIGFLWLFVEPTLFVGFTVLVRAFIKSAGFALNFPIVAFALTGWTSMLLWRNMPSRCMGAHRSNMSLLYHQPVTLLDVYIARVVLEFVSITSAFVALSVLFHIAGWVPAPEDPIQVFWAWLLLGWFGLGLGWTIGALSEKSNLVVIVWRLSSFLLMISSGVFYLADSLPPHVRAYALWMPMLNMVEYLREGWFGSVFRAHYDILYVVICNLVLTFAGLSLVRQIGTDLAEDEA